MPFGISWKKDCHTCKIAGKSWVLVGIAWLEDRKTWSVLWTMGDDRPEKNTDYVVVLNELKSPSHFRTESDDPIGCYGKPMEQTNEIKGRAISMVPFSGFP